MRWMVDKHVQMVARALRKAGVSRSNIDDEIQRTFIIAARRLDDVQRGAERKFLSRVARHVAAHAHRTLARRREVLAERPPERIETIATPEHLTDRKQMREVLDGVIDRLGESLRAVFILHELQEMNLTDIAAVLGIPRGTAASRLRRARAAFRESLAALDTQERRQK